MDAPGGGEIGRELDLRNTLDGGVQVLRGAISVDVGEPVRWFDGVVSGAGSGGIVYVGNWGSLLEVVPDESKVGEINVRS